MSLALFGLLLGMMIGRLTEPAPVQLLQVQRGDGQLALLFDDEPKVYAEQPEGTLALLFEAHGEEASGSLTVAGRPANWRLSRTERGLLLEVVALRPLRASLAGEADPRGWRVQVQLRGE